MTIRIERSLPWCLGAFLALFGGACTTTHDAAPQAGTETGNPPVIDASLVSLVVSQDEVHVRGQPGAATPGAEIEVTSALTGAVFEGRAASDGSFDIRVDTPTTDSFEVRATLGGQSSSTVQVMRGGASVGEGDASVGGGAQGLSCAQRDQMAGAAMSAAASNADDQCERDDDCVLGRAQTLCSDSCYDRPVSSAGAQALEDARSEIESGLCRDFAADGCQKILLPCLPGATGPIGCRAGRCQIVEQPSSDCSSAFEPGGGFAAIQVYWFDPQRGVCLPAIWGGVDGNGNRYETLEACESACAPKGECPPNSARASVCVAPGPIAGCAEMATACARVCSEHDHCAGDRIGTYCLDGLCQAWSPF